jgi:hypothetical protein
MDRCKEYFGFAISFAGLGYIALWPLASYGGDLLGVSLHPLALPPALQMTGVLSAIFVAVRLLLAAARRWRGRAAAAVRAPQAAPATPLRRREPARYVTSVKPRSHFGLRGR